MGFLIYPNPYLLDTHHQVNFSLNSSTNGHLEIYDFSMSKVFDNDCVMDGSYTKCTWNGLNSRGDKVANGVYFCKMKIGHKIHWEKLGVIKFQ